MRQRYNTPRGIKRRHHGSEFAVGLSGSVTLLFRLTDGLFCLLGCFELYAVSNEQGARDKQIKDSAQNGIAAAIVVAGYADENSILLRISIRSRRCIGSETLTFLKFSIIRRKLDTTNGHINAC